MTNAYTQRHQDHQAQAQTHTANLERLLATANQLYRDRSVVVSLFDRPVTNSNVRRIAQVLSAYPAAKRCWTATRFASIRRAQCQRHQKQPSGYRAFGTAS